MGAAEAPPGSFLGSLGHFFGLPSDAIGAQVFCFFPEGAFSKFGLAFSLENYMFYDGVFQNLAFRSRMRPNI